PSVTPDSPDGAASCGDGRPPHPSTSTSRAGKQYTKRIPQISIGRDGSGIPPEIHITDESITRPPLAGMARGCWDTDWSCQTTAQHSNECGSDFSKKRQIRGNPSTPAVEFPFFPGARGTRTSPRARPIGAILGNPDCACPCLHWESPSTGITGARGA